jgi:glycosyltransferase involved in cell wall biosynthesis
VNRQVAIALHEPSVGGASLAVLNPLPLLERDGWRFTFWVPRPSPIAELLETRGYTVAGEPRALRYSRAAWREPPGTWTRARSVPGYLRRFRQYIQATDPDVVHVNSVVALPEALVARSTGAPTLLNVHEMLHGTKGAAAARLARLVDGVATVSNACAAPLIARGATVHLVTPCVPLIEELRRPVGRERLVVGTLATISERKGSDTFVAMARALLARRDDVEFRMVGTVPTGADEQWARDVVACGERHGVRWSVTTTPVAELRDWDAFVLPTRRDPFPLAVLEAMAAGLPVVASAVDGVPEQVDEASAILVAPDDADALVRAVERLLDDKSLRTSMGQHGVERVTRCFAPERQASELVSAYENVLRCAEGRRRGR